jgi:hypothetical protein
MLHLCEYDATQQSSDKVCAKAIVAGITVAQARGPSAENRARLERNQSERNVFHT